jgi:superfamily II DNA or RNA helicase
LDVLFSAMPDFQLRPYQVKIDLNVARNWFLKSQLIVAPTGSGKTPTGLACAKRFVEEIGPDILGVRSEDIGVVWMAHRQELLAQALKQNQMVQCPNLEITSLYANPKKTAERFAGKYKKLIMVGDEAHHTACQSAVSIINELEIEYILGLSATPVRSDRARLCFVNQVVEGNYNALIESGYLSPYDYYCIENWQPATVAATYLEDREKWGKTVMFFRTEIECSECMDILQQHGVLPELVTGSSDRASQLKRFADGTTQVLINMAVLTEGFDEPSIKTVFTRDTASESAMIQQSGRALRLHDETPVKQVVQSSQCLHPFTKIANCRRKFEFQNSQWHELKVGHQAIDDALAAYRESVKNLLAVKSSGLKLPKGSRLK